MLSSSDLCMPTAPPGNPKVCPSLSRILDFLSLFSSSSFPLSPGPEALLPEGGVCKGHIRANTG